MRFLDTNVLVRFLTGIPPEQFRRSVTLFQSVERGDERIILNSVVIFESVWVLNRSYDVPMERVRDVMLTLINLPNVQLTDKPLYERAFDVSIELNIPFADAFSAAFMEANGIVEVYSWDHHFDRIDGIIRVEPGDGTQA